MSTTSRRLSLKRAVAERDNWTCCHCQQPVDPSLPMGHPLRRTIERVTPRSKGGTMSYANLRLTHATCHLVSGGSRP